MVKPPAKLNSVETTFSKTRSHYCVTQEICEYHTFAYGLKCLWNTFKAYERLAEISRKTE